MVEEKETDQENPQRKSVSAEGRKENQRISVSQNRPPITETSNPIKKDPVSEQKKKDEKDMKRTHVIPQKESNLSTQIKPTLSKRIDLKFVDDGTYKEGEPKTKYVVPKTKRQQKYYEKNRANTAKKFCKYSSSRVPKPQPDRKMDLKIEVPSPEPSQAKVTPRKVTPTASMLYPYPQTDSELKIKKPKSGIIINEKEAEGQDSDDDYDSFDLVFSRKPRPKSSRKRSKSRKHDGLEDIVEDEEEADGTREKKKKKKKGKHKKGGIEEVAEEEADEAEADGKTDYLTKQFRRKVSQMSAATSYHSQLIEPPEQEIVGEPAFSKYVQKFRRESEMQRYQPKRRKVKRGTLESHSFTDINQVVLKDFFFGSKEGTMHQGDPSFPPSVRNIQGLCMPVAAYCYSILKHPNKWTRENIDEILGYGNELFSQSARVAHIHNLSKLLEFNELQKYCIIGEKKIRFTVDDPEVAGYIRSDDKKVYNLTKALRIFFSRNKAGILKTQDICIGVWKHKYFYMFDARPRTRDLFCSPAGTAIMANFYDVSALATVFLARSNFGNWPFVIYPLKALRVLNRDDPEVDSNADLDVASEYNILNANKAVVLASFDLADKCFDFSRNKQSLAMAVVCLAYSRITPPSAWHRTTVDKIMIIGNQLYLQCLECESIVDLKLDNLPALFTIGPYIVEIYIYANVYADLLFRSCCCQLRCCLEEFFEKCTNAIVQIGKGCLAVWKQRNMFYCFDPYSRNNEGYRCRDGAACVSMHSTVESLVEVITTNFDAKDTIFYVHAMKVCKIHRDPAQTSRFPRHLAMDDIAVDEIKQYKMKKSKKAATEKPVTVDYSALAMRKLLAGESPQDSIFDIGSTVESLAMDQIPPMLHKNVSKSILKAHPKVVDVVADLDSPSLSDTQIEPPLPQQPKITEDIEFLDLDSFELTMEEIELEVVEQQEDENELNYDGGEEIMMGEGENDFEQMPEQTEYMGMGGEGDDLDDWFFATDMYSQYSGIKKPSQMSEQVNTDITYFPIKREILYPTYLRDRQRVKYRLQKYKFTEEDWENYLPPSPPEITRSEELKKETNFVDLPDDTQIILGGKNVADSGGEDVEFVAPFVCIMAGVVAKKYSISSWTPEIVDYIIKCGNELHAASKFRYDQVSKLEIPRISLGNTDFTVLVEYVFDSYTRQNILELALEKILFVRSDVGIFVTPVYACAVFYKNHLYYVYDCFGNNEVGLSEGPSGKGAACLARFKDLRSLTSRMMYNKRKRESSEEIVYSRFVLSSVKVKELRDPGREKKKKKKSKVKKTDAAKDDEYLYQGEDEIDEAKQEEEKKDDDSVDEDDEKPEDQEEKPEEKEKKKESENNIGYQYKNGFYTIQGTKVVGGRKTVSEELKEDHFICLCACLVLLTCPVKKWDTKKVDKVLDYGKHVYSHAEDLNVSQKRTIKNILIGEYFFDVIVKSIKIENWRDNKSLNEGIDTILARKTSYFLVQFPNACYVIHKSSDAILHLFDPYGVPKSQKAGWTRFKDARHLKRRLKRIVVAGAESYKFYTFEITSIQKAPKGMVLSHKLEEYEIEAAVKKEYQGKPFYEDVEWLQTDPVPWSRKKEKSACGKARGTLENMWFNWDEEYPNDLYSLVGNIHEYNERFSNKTKGKQTLANLITAIGMMEIYDLSEWNSSVVDSVLVNGDHYFTDCIQDISEEDYELTMDDLKPDCSIFPFSFQVALTPVVEGTMFLVRLTQFNLYKALRYFFDGFDTRYGLICCTKSDRKKHVAFGKLRDAEYFVFDSGCRGAPMFLDGAGVAYVLRMTTLNRLLHVLTLTLRGGDFYVHEVAVSDLKPMS